MAASGPKSEAGAPSDEMKIAAEMIEAGMAEYSAHWLGLRDADDDEAREMLRLAFQEMWRRSPRALGRGVLGSA